MLRVAVIGDSGTGTTSQRRLAKIVSQCEPDVVLMCGDNCYEHVSLHDAFYRPYAQLLSRRVPFYSVLGNHDNVERSLRVREWRMRGRRYYALRDRKSKVAFIGLDSSRMDEAQIQWLERKLDIVPKGWRKIVWMHHPLYSNTHRHVSNGHLRTALEPVLVKHGVDLVFAGHDHVYERFPVIRGVQHVIVGSSGKVDMGSILPHAVASGYKPLVADDQHLAFVCCDIYLSRVSVRAYALADRSPVCVDCHSLTNKL